MSEAVASLPAITDEDITWVQHLMGLQKLDGPRMDFLRRLSTVDVPACPGSGKTTLVVAKLAILARHWPWRTRGVCVLSHTNVAREEIEKRLGPTPVGHYLARYPHYIDTIHGFLGRFLAIPFLRSHGKTFQAFDDDLTNRARRRFLGSDMGKLDFYLTKKHTSIESIRIKNTAYDLGEFPDGPNTNMYCLAQSAVSHAAASGYFCFSDVFLLAEALLREVPSVANILHQRFPFVMLDEIQDTDGQQGRILAALFPRDREDICIQRVGDPNQAIYEEDSESDETGFPDPDPDRCLTISNSFRFGQQIASCVSPIAVTPPGPEGLRGNGPCCSAHLEPHPTILLFPDDAPQRVLPAFAEMLLEALPDNVLAQGTVAAVAAVQKAIPNPDQKKFPQSLCQYWDGYEPSVNRKPSHPATLVEYILGAQRKAATNSTFGDATNDIGFALLHLVRLQVGVVSGSIRSRFHRRIIDKLGEADATTYTSLLVELLGAQIPITLSSWTCLRLKFLTLLNKLGGGHALIQEAQAFLDWPKRLPSDLATSEKCRLSGQRNIYHYLSGSRTVDIRLGSIHSVKGETFLATLVLDVFNYHFFSMSLIDHLRKAPPKKKKPGKVELQHRRLAFVAMTRPTHMLCLAMRSSTLGQSLEAEQLQRELEAQGWRVIRIR